jgi:hypothetical protein
MKTLILLLIFCSLFQIAFSQEQNNPVQISGDFGFYSDFYHMESDTPGAVAPRRPASLERLVVNASLNIKDFSLPVSMAIANNQFSVVVPNPPVIPHNPFQNFKSIVTNPLNRIGIAPKYKWVQLLLGSQIPQYSELSVGDLSVFGIGVNLTPGKFRFSFFEGTSQIAIEEDTLKNIKGSYKRKIYSTKIGYGSEDSSHIYFIESMMKDDTASLIYKPVSLMPQAGILSDIDFRINLGKKSFIKGEVAGSMFTRDMRNNNIDKYGNSIPKEIYTPKESTRQDDASVLSIGADGKSFGIKATGRYIGDGFVPLGYPFMQSDRLEVTIDPHLNLFENKLQLSGSIGRRVNNLSQERGTTSTQTLGMINLNAQLTEQLSLSANYTNFGFRNAMVSDTFKVEMLTVSWSVSPAYNIITKTTMHNIMLMYSQNTFNDYNTVSGALNNNDASNAVFSYIFSMLNNPLSVSTLLSYFDNSTSFGRLTTKSLNLTAGYKFFKKKLSPTAGLTIADNRINSGSSGYQVMTILGAKYTWKKKLNFGLNGSVNVFKYGNTKPGISYREDLLRTSITYKL